MMAILFTFLFWSLIPADLHLSENTQCKSVFIILITEYNAPVKIIKRCKIFFAFVESNPQ